MSKTCHKLVECVPTCVDMFWTCLDLSGTCLHMWKAWNVYEYVWNMNKCGHALSMTGHVLNMSGHNWTFLIVSGSCEVINYILKILVCVTICLFVYILRRVKITLSRNLFKSEYQSFCTHYISSFFGHPVYYSCEKVVFTEMGTGQIYKVGIFRIRRS